MEALIKRLIPHAPHLGLYLAPDIPSRKLERALRQYGSEMQRNEVVALYDATRLGTAGDGSLFGPQMMTFRNSRLQAAHSVLYRDIVGVNTGRRFLAGRYIDVQVNRGQATVTLRIDFAARPGAAEYVARLLGETMVVDHESRVVADLALVEQELRNLVRRGALSESDLMRMMSAISRNPEAP